MTDIEKPFSPACERNRDPILAVLKKCMPEQGTLLEIGTGTGQHAVYFAPHFPNLTWQTSDLQNNHPGIQLWLDEAQLDNLRSPLSLDVSQTDWPIDHVDAVYSANTAHIMPWAVTQQMIAGVGQRLSTGGVFALYGPFNYNGRFTSESNAEFEEWLKSRDPLMGIRDFEAVCEVAAGAGMHLINDVGMPANNRMLVFGK